MCAAPQIVSYVPGEALTDGASFDLVRPLDGKITGRIVEAGASGVDVAVRIATAASQACRKAPVHERVSWLKRIAGVLVQSADEIADVISEDVGKPIRSARFEVRRGAEFVEACASALPNIRGDVLPLDVVAAGQGHFGFTRHIPYGVVAAITPFNAPVNLLMQKVAPGIAAGNAVIAKPAPAGTRTAILLAKTFEQAGLPRGLFTVLAGDRITALALSGHPGVALVSFTGGTAAGDILARSAGAKKFTAELGSNAANIVLADADIDDAATRIATAAFEASGQQCISPQRVLVHSSVYRRFTSQFVIAATALKVGHPGDPATDIGPMVSRAAADRVMLICAEAVAAGAAYALEPRQDGATVSPGIVERVSRQSRLWTDEIFGPIAIVTPFDSQDEALNLANDSPFGLQGAVFTRDLKTAFSFADDFDVGSIWINEASRFRLDIYPFGGVKRSGVGREGVRYAIEEMSQIKFVGIRP